MRLTGPGRRIRSAIAVPKFLGKAAQELIEERRKRVTTEKLPEICR